MDQEYMQYLKDLLSKAGSKVSDNIQNPLQNASMAAKAEMNQIANPDYELSPEELAAQKASEENTMGTAMGTLGAAPKTFGALTSKLTPRGTPIQTAEAIKAATPIVGDTAAKEIAAKQLSDKIAESAQAGAEKGLMGAPTQSDIAKATALLNRHMDFAKRANDA
jgi:hypothetical protein